MSESIEPLFISPTDWPVCSICKGIGWRILRPAEDDPDAWEWCPDCGGGGTPYAK